MAPGRAVPVSLDTSTACGATGPSSARRARLPQRPDLLPGRRRLDEFVPAGTRARAEADPRCASPLRRSTADTTLAHPDPPEAMVWRRAPTTKGTTSPAVPIIERLDGPD